jgi:hypothetical protein
LNIIMVKTVKVEASKYAKTLYYRSITAL